VSLLAGIIHQAVGWMLPGAAERLSIAPTGSGTVELIETGGGFGSRH
jgi:hypothetical protein